MVITEKQNKVGDSSSAALAVITTVRFLPGAFCKDRFSPPALASTAVRVKLGSSTPRIACEPLPCQSMDLDLLGVSRKPTKANAQADSSTEKPESSSFLRRQRYWPA
jgi:hypothetical protein